jgi:hypothetical protein
VIVVELFPLLHFGVEATYIFDHNAFEQIGSPKVKAYLYRLGSLHPKKCQDGGSFPLIRMSAQRQARNMTGLILDGAALTYFEPEKTSGGIHRLNGIWAGTASYGSPQTDGRTCDSF